MSRVWGTHRANALPMPFMLVYAVSREEEEESDEQKRSPESRRTRAREEKRRAMRLYRSERASVWRRSQFLRQLP